MTRRELVPGLSAANSGTGCANGDWEIRSVDQEKLTVSQSGLSLCVRQEECEGTQASLITPGRRVSIRLPKEFPEISPGFYIAVGNFDLTRSDWRQVVRLYWNVTPKGSVRLMQAITSLLNRRGTPFRLKVTTEASRFARCDSAVLYIRRTDYEDIREHLEDIYGELRNSLRQGTPVFAKPLAPALGLAEEPQPGSSFGLNRCRLLAQGLIRAYDQRQRSHRACMEAVCEEFRQAGIDVAKPYLNPNSEDLYEFRTASQHSSAAHRRPGHLLKASFHRIDESGYNFLNAAHELGVRVSREAVWHEDRCNWVAVSAADTENMAYSNLGPEVYSGTSGVALFLAELYRASGDPAILRTARGAVRHALSNVEMLSPSVRSGLYAGWTGIAITAARIGVLLQEEQYLDAGRQLLTRALRGYDPASQADLISGRAGAIVALLAALHLFKDDVFRDFAQRLGDDLVASARVSGEGYSWRTTNGRGECHLTGFSHGAAGIAYSLLELYGVSRDPRHCRSARLAFDYERSWFDTKARNWPDLRRVSARVKRRAGALPFTTVWCHGAPGIALSRLIAFSILRDDHFKAEALTALSTTQGHITSDLSRRKMNCSLCHGLMGNADVLHIGAQILGDEFSTGLECAREAGYDGILRYSSSGEDWTCGARGGITPSLMLGLAGIGYFYLRLHDPAVPSVLMIGSDFLTRAGSDKTTTAAASVLPDVNVRDRAPRWTF